MTINPRADVEYEELLVSMRKAAQQALVLFGKARQRHKAIEECNELAVAVAHWADNKATDEEVATEVADVLLMCEQLGLMLGRDLLNTAIKQKLKKLQGILDDAQSPYAEEDPTLLVNVFKDA